MFALLLLCAISPAARGMRHNVADSLSVAVKTNIMSVPTAPIQQSITCASEKKPIMWGFHKNGQATGYLQGTYHVPYKLMQPIPSVLQGALKCANKLFFELECPVSAYASKDMGCYSYPDGSTIKSRLPVPVFESMLQQIREASQYWTPVSRAAAGPLIKALETGQMSLTLLVIAETLDMLSAPEFGREHGDIFDDWLRAQGPSAGLEKLDTHCSIFQNLTSDDDLFIAQAIIERAVNESKEMQRVGVSPSLRATFCGDMDLLKGLSLAKMSKPLSKLLLNDRNKVMADGIVKALDSKPDKTILAAVGAAHFLSDDMLGVRSVQDFLADAGYSIWRIEDSEADLDEHVGCGQDPHWQCAQPQCSAGEHHQEIEHSNNWLTCHFKGRGVEHCSFSPKHCCCKKGYKYDSVLRTCSQCPNGEKPIAQTPGGNTKQWLEYFKWLEVDLAF